MAKKIDPASIARSKQKPTTGNGRTGGQKPKLSETNLPGSNRQSWLAGLFTRRSRPGRHE